MKKLLPLLLFLVITIFGYNAAENGYLYVKVVDGDTVKVDGKTYRIAGIDTPETVHPAKPVECYGPEATNRAKSLFMQQVKVHEMPKKNGSENIDRYGRYIAYIELADGRDYGEVMIKEGYAKHYDNYWHMKSGEYEVFEREAIKYKKGLWGKCK